MATLPMVFRRYLANTFLACVLAFLTSETTKLTHDRMALAFAVVFALRYSRLVVHIIYYWVYLPALTPKETIHSERDVTVIIPTIDPHKYLTRCLASIIVNKPAKIIIVTAGLELKQQTCQVVTDWIKTLAADPKETEIQIISVSEPSKRRQMAHAVTKVTTKFIVSVDDSVVWPNRRLIRSLLDAFEEDASIGLVGSTKRVYRDATSSLVNEFWNFIGCIYLARHNFEIRATNAANGGVFVVSGRTFAVRSSILQDPTFAAAYTTETFWGRPLLPDDDNFLHRWIVRDGWRVKIQDTPDARIETSLGTYPRFLSQCTRWARTTFRSNPVMLLEGRVLWMHPWTSFGAIIAGMFNFALVVDPLMVYLLMNSSLYRDSSRPMLLLASLIVCIISSKMVKLIPHFLLHPRDLIFFPGYIAFAYFHSLLKAYALLTVWDVSWSGRKLEQIGTANETNKAVELKKDP